MWLDVNGRVIAGSWERIGMAKCYVGNPEMASLTDLCLALINLSAM